MNVELWYYRNTCFSCASHLHGTECTDPNHGYTRSDGKVCDMFMDHWIGADGTTVFGNECVNLGSSLCILSKDVKRFEYLEDNHVTLGNKQIPADDICYLRVNNRVIIDSRDEE